MGRSRKPEVHSITGARSGRSDDVSDRTRRYLISMGIRTACVLGAVLAHGPLRWAMVAGAVVLPYIAVVAANTARSAAPGARPAPVLPGEAPGLAPGTSEPPRA